MSGSIVSSDDLPTGIMTRANINYEHSNKKKHLITEIRSDDFKICTPKKYTTSLTFGARSGYGWFTTRMKGN